MRLWGGFATYYIFKKFDLKIDKISNIHGRIYNVSNINGDIRIIPLYHPAIATYNVKTKKILFEDFKLIKKVFDEC